MHQILSTCYFNLWASLFSHTSWETGKKRCWKGGKDQQPSGNYSIYTSRCTVSADMLGYPSVLSAATHYSPNGMLIITSVSARSVFSRVRSLVTIPFWGEKWRKKTLAYETRTFKHIKQQQASSFPSSPKEGQWGKMNLTYNARC